MPGKPSDPRVPYLHVLLSWPGINIVRFLAYMLSERELLLYSLLLCVCVSALTVFAAICNLTLSGLGRGLLPTMEGKDNTQKSAFTCLF